MPYQQDLNKAEFSFLEAKKALDKAENVDYEKVCGLYNKAIEEFLEILTNTNYEELRNDDHINANLKTAYMNLVFALSKQEKWIEAKEIFERNPFKVFDESYKTKALNIINSKLFEESSNKARALIEEMQRSQEDEGAFKEIMKKFIDVYKEADDLFKSLKVENQEVYKANHESYALHFVVGSLKMGVTEGLGEFISGYTLDVKAIEQNAQHMCRQEDESTKKQGISSLTALVELFNAGGAVKNALEGNADFVAHLFHSGDEELKLFGKQLIEGAAIAPAPAPLQIPEEGAAEESEEGSEEGAEEGAVAAIVPVQQAQAQLHTSSPSPASSDLFVEGLGSLFENLDS
jgi:tetratricopeptide (TPR) repeat protein